MDWGIIAQAIFFLAIGFIAIIVTIFVFATSLLGLAIRRASSEKERLQAEQRQKTSKELEKLQEQLDKAKKERNAQEVDRLGKAVAKLVKQLRRDEKSLASIPKRYSLPFTVRVGVIWPGTCFLLSSVFSGIAWSLFRHQSEVWIGHQNTSLPSLAYLLMGLAISAIICGVYRLYCNLKAIQEVSITSEEAVLGRMTEAVKTGYRQYVAEKKPEMRLLFEEPEAPIQIVQGGEAAIKFKVALVKGEIGREAAVTFLAPLDFDFTTEGAYWYRLEPTADAVAVEYRLGLIMPKYFYPASLTVKAPPKTGTFTLHYMLQCEGFTSDYEEFDVSVTS